MTEVPYSERYGNESVYALVLTIANLVPGLHLRRPQPRHLFAGIKRPVVHLLVEVVRCQRLS